jgi:carbamoyl-phosphate synthase large subunit
MSNRIKILVSSVGSLVGQNILDVLENEYFYRRNLTEIIGTNSIEESPNNYRCDKCYLLPNTSTEEFKKKLVEIIKYEKPELVLSGRDEDTETIAKIIRNNNLDFTKTPYGKISSLTIALDKWESWKFTQKYNLPFAATFRINSPSDKKKLDEFISNYGFPLIAKPVQGFASKGVFFINSKEEALATLENQNYILQEYLGNGETLSSYFNSAKGPVPLFIHAPNIHHFSCHIIISPNGEFSSIFISKNEHNSGITMGFRKIFNHELEDLTKRYASAIYKEGGYGPLTVQFKADKNNIWKAQEMNLRTNGNTYPRFLLGQDDLGLIIKGIFPEKQFPIYNFDKNPFNYVVAKTLNSNILNKNEIEMMKNELKWSKKEWVKEAI